MKFNKPSEFFKYIIERADINVVNDNQKCLALALDLLDSEKPYFNLLKITLYMNLYKERVKAYKADSKAKSVCINKTVKTLNEKCFIEKDKAIWAVGWLASVIYPNEWKTFLNQINSNKEEDEEIVWEQVNTTKRDSYKEETNTHNPTPIIIGVDRDNNSTQNNIFNNQNWTLNDINLEMIYCPAGKFIMGSSGFEKGRYYNEIQHMVIISKPFFIGKYPIT